jgi:hypothetical protein
MTRGELTRSPRMGVNQRRYGFDMMQKIITR